MFWRTPSVVLIAQLLLLPLLCCHHHAADGHPAPHVHLASLFGEHDDRDHDHDHDAVYLPEFDLAAPGHTSPCADLDALAPAALVLPCLAPALPARFAGRADGRPPDPPLGQRNLALLV